jgi:hypothetical protein
VQINLSRTQNKAFDSMRLEREIQGNALYKNRLRRSTEKGRKNERKVKKAGMTRS